MLICLAALALLSFSDIRYRIIPKGLNFSAFMALALFMFMTHPLSGLVYPLGTYLTYCLVFRLSSGRIGYGDVRVAPLAMDYHTLDPTLVHLLGWSLAGLYVLTSRNLKGSVPFAPFLLASALIINHL